MVSTQADSCGAGLGQAVFEPTNLEYTWSDNQTGSTRTNLVAGTYEVTVSTSGCSNTTTVIIEGIDCATTDPVDPTNPTDTTDATNQPLPVVPTDPVDPANLVDSTDHADSCLIVVGEPIITPASCLAADGTVDFTNAPANLTFEWFDNQVLTIRNDLPANEYLVLVRDSNKPDCPAMEIVVTVGELPCAPTDPVDPTNSLDTTITSDQPIVIDTSNPTDPVDPTNSLDTTITSDQPIVIDTSNPTDPVDPTNSLCLLYTSPSPRD